MSGALLVVLIVLAAAGAAYASYTFKKKRREALAVFAKQYRLEYSQDDPFGLTGSPFHLFTLGDGQGCENVVWGDWQGIPMREADYWYYTESTDSEGHRTKSYHKFSVVIAEVGCSVPYVSLAKEGLLTKLADHLGFRDIDFESEAFNRAFNVKSEDREFAYRLIDARMEQFLLETGGAFGFEVRGSELLVYSDRRGPADLVPLFGTAKAFHEHIPRLVWNEYGKKEERSTTWPS